MQLSSLPLVGRTAVWLAGVFSPPYKGRRYLAKLTKRGYFSPSAVICCEHLSSGDHVFIGDRVTIYDAGEGQVVLGDRACIHQDSVIEVGMGGGLIVGNDTHIQPRCQISAYLGTVTIGANVQIAPGCAFYPYNHSTAAGQAMQRQPLETKGGIVVEDDVWIGFGVIVLDGVRVGKGAVLGAGAVVSSDIPSNAIAAGVPARVLGTRAAPKAVG